MPKIISIGTLKGGVGKTTSNYHIAGILAEKYNVLCIDVDPQGNFTDAFGIDRTDVNLVGSERIFLDNRLDFADIVFESPIKELPKLDVIPATTILQEAENSLASQQAREHRLKYFLEDNKTFIDYYDYIFIDTSPSMGLLNVNAFYVTDSILFPLTAENDDIKGIQLFCAKWDIIRAQLRKEDNIAGMFINKLDRRNSADKGLRKFILTSETTEDIRPLLLDTDIPINMAIKDAKSIAKPIQLFDEKSPGCKAYIKLVKELTERGIL